MSGLAVAVECAVRRGRTRFGRLLATAVAVAVGIAGLMLVAVATTIAGDSALQRGVAALDPAVRAFTVTLAPDLAPTTADLTAFNNKITGRLQRRGLGPTVQTVEFRALAAGDGRSVRFAGLDDLHHVTRLVDGAWPARCDAERCEVVAVVAASPNAAPVAPLPADSPLGLTIVGTVVTTSDLVLSGELRPDDSELILLTDGVAKASALPAFELFRRTYAWQAPVAAEQLRSIDLDSVLSGVRTVGSDPTLPGLHVSGPEDELRSISSRTHITSNRLAVPIAALLVLFLGVAALAGLGGRADHQRTAALLHRRGAGRGVLVCFRMLEAALPVIAGALIGVGLGLPVGAWLGHRAGVGGRSVISRSVDGSLVLRLAAACAVVWFLIFAMLSLNDLYAARRRRRLLASDVAGSSAIVVLLVLVARGSVSTGSLNRTVDPALVAVPILAAIGLAALVVRVVPLALRSAAAATPRRRPLTKLVLAEATAQPLRAIATASLIAVTVMFSLLTFGYASTLRLGSRDQAAFAVPYDFRMQLGASLVRPQALAPKGGWASLAPATTSTDVLRRGVAVRSSATTTQTLELIGLDPTTLVHLHGWRSSFGRDPSQLASSLEQPAPAPVGAAIPADAVSIDFSGSGFAGLQTSAVIARVDGTWHEISLDDEAADGPGTTLTPGDAGGRLVGFRVAQPADVSARIEHHIGEGDTSEEARPVDVVLRAVQTAASTGRTSAIALPVDRLRAANATVEVQPDSALRVTGSILGAAILVTPLGPGQDTVVDAVVDPFTASTAINGTILAETSSGTLRLHAVAVADRFPGTAARFAIVDISTLQPALDLLQPGAGTANELWLAADSTAHERLLADRLSGAGFDTVEVSRRSSLQAALATDPLSNVTLAILTASALVAAVLATCAMLLGAAADASDDRPLLRMLALERVAGRRLMGLVAGKSLAAICVAIPLGILAGRWLLQIATRLVAVSATSIQPSPPLRLSMPWIVVLPLVVVLLVLLATAAVVGASSARRVPHEDLMRGTA